MHTNQINYKIIAKPFLIHKKHFGQTDKVLLNALYTCLAEPEQKVVLDLGCGNGKIANEVVEKIASIQKVFALDIEKDLIEDAQENNAHSKIVYSVVNPGKVDTKILADNSVDIAYSVYVLMEPKEETTVLAIIQNAYDKLTPGGTYCALNSNIGEFAGKECYSYKIDTLPTDIQENEKTTTYLRIGIGNTTQDWLEIHDYYRSIKKYIELFEAVGFQHIEVKRILIPANTYSQMKDEATTAPAYIISGAKPGP